MQFTKPELNELRSEVIPDDIKEGYHIYNPICSTKGHVGNSPTTHRFWIGVTWKISYCLPKTKVEVAGYLGESSVYVDGQTDLANDSLDLYQYIKEVDKSVQGRFETLLNLQGINRRKEDLDVVGEDLSKLTSQIMALLVKRGFYKN